MECGVDITLTENPENNCQYDLKISINEKCGGFTFTQFTINTGSDFMDPAEIKSVEDLYGGLNIERPTAALAILTNSGITGQFIFEAGAINTIARFEFENGSNSSEITFGISGTNPEGQARDYSMKGSADANCIVQNPPCVCSIDLRPDPNFICCYDIIAEQIGGQCFNSTYGNIQINTINGGSQTSSMYDEQGYLGNNAVLTGTSMLDIVPPTGGWGFLPGVSSLNVGRVCFDNGTNPENVNLSWQGTGPGGTALSCANSVPINASCPRPIDCSCILDYQQVDECCYEVGVTYTGADCPNLSFTDVVIDATANPGFECEIWDATPAAGAVAGQTITASPITTGTTQVTFSSSTNLGNISARQVIGEVCFNNGINPTISNAKVSIMDNSNSGIECEETIEAETCEDPVFGDKLLGDSLSNIPVKVIPVGFNKMQVLANTEENGQNYGVLLQYDLSSGIVDWFHKSDPGMIYNDVAYHPGVRTSYIVGFTSTDPNLDNESMITTVDKFNGYCIDVVTYAQTGREFFKKIEYVPTSNGVDDELYIVASKNPALPADDKDLLYLMNIKTNLVQNWYEEVNHTPWRDDEMFRGIIPRPNNDGVMIVGNDSNNNRGAWVEIDGNGGYINDRILDDRIDLYDGHIFNNLDKLLVGEEFNVRQAIITLWDQNDVMIDGLIFPSLKSFEELVFDGTHFYAIAHRKAPPEENVIVKFHIEANQIIIDKAYDTDNGEPDFKLGKINLHRNNLLLYADARIPQTGAGFGDFDMYVAAYDYNSFESECLEEITLSPGPYNVTSQHAAMTLNPNNLPGPMGGPNCQPITYDCFDYCEPFYCDPGWDYESKGCYEIQFTDTSLVNLPATYMWDINGDGTVDTLAKDFCYDFGCAGTFMVCLKVTDRYGNEKTVCKNVVVGPDTTPPVCSGAVGPSPISVAACKRGAVRSWTPPTFTDDCDSQPTITSTHQPGDFFPCGTTRVTYTGTNKDGLSSTCFFDVRVNCLCAATDSTSISCGVNPDEFDFYFKLDDLSGATSCSAANVTMGGLGTVNVITNVWDPTAKTLEVSGTIQATAYPFPTSFGLQVDYQCRCPDGDPYNCLHNVYFTTPCCDSAYINPEGICTTKDEEFVDIQFWGTVRDIAQVDYYITPAPCTAPPWTTGTPYQSSLGYAPLKIIPSAHSQDICVYACVILGSDELPCDTLKTDIVTLKLCNPYDCSLNDQEFCFMGTPITPAPITYNGPLPDCDFKIDWYDNLGNYIPLPAITTTYQPPALVYRGGPDDCSEDYVYEMQLIGECDTFSCFSTITLWNDDAPEGIIEMDPIENLPLCYGEDITLAHRDSCVDPTGEWTWHSSLDGISYGPIPGAGTANPVYNSNRLYQDHWYAVTKQNGTCPEDTTFFEVPIKPDFTITACNADALDPCRESGVKLSVQYNPCLPSLNGVCNCNYTIDWFKNGQLIGTTNSTQPSSGFTYIDFSLNGNYAGIYYAEVTDNCCGTTKRSLTKLFDPPVKLCISGPCYVCEKGTSFTLTGSLKNGPAIGNNCTYQWYILAPSGYQAIAGATSITHTTTKCGQYLLDMKCTNGNTSCKQQVEFEVKDCSTNSGNSTSIFQQDQANFDFTIAPNPSSGAFLIERDGTTYEEMEVQLYNVLGQKISTHRMAAGAKSINLEQLESGVYLIRMVSQDDGAKTKQLVIQ